uniref:Secreted phosphoprotein 24 n=1 Tax=Lepisosteus oculatus TaxID=7918 RepID=W5MWB6_LEPOC
MKATCLFLVGLHFLRGSGLPVFPLDQPLAEHALNASIAHVNAQSRGPNLYGITRSFIRNVIPTGQDSYNMILNFGIQETICPQNSGKDPDECDFKTGHFVVSSSCSSRVQFAGDRIQGLSVQCDSSTSSSSESDSS